MKNRYGFMVLILALLWTSTVALAQEPVTFSVEAGLDGYYRVGQWLPVRALIENKGPSIDGRVEVILPRADEGQITYAYPVSLPTQSRKEIAFDLRPEAYTSGLEVRWVDNAGHVIAQQNVSLKALGDTDQLYALIADQPSAYNLLSELDPTDGAAQVAQLTVRGLPDRSAALASLSTLIISNVDTGALTDAQRAALSAWIANGGRLIVTGGPGWQKTAAGLNDLLPLSPATTTSLADLSALKNFAGSASTPGSTIVTGGALSPDAQIILQQGTTPLIVRRPQGFGEVVFSAFDPATLQQAGGQRWDGLLEFYRQLDRPLPEKPGWSYGVQDWYTAASAASIIPNLNLPPVSLMCGFLVLYVVAIGPVNYLIVRKLKRRELAWITVPLLTLLFIGATFITGNILRGNQPVLNRLALVEVWPTSQQARVTGIVGLYAPQRAVYEVQADQGVLLHPATDATPYRSIGDTSDWTLSSAAAAQRARVEMDVSEVKTLSAEGEVPAPRFTPDVQLIVDQAGVRASGTVVNGSDLVLHDAVLLGPGLANRIGTINPGQSVPVELQLDRATRSSEVVKNAPYYYNYGQTSATVEDIVGTSSYGNNDPVSQRRYEMLNAILNGSTPARPGRGSGIYLAGWSDQSPLDVNVANRPFGAYNTTLYMVDLNPTLQLMSGPLTLQPGLFTWQPGDVSSSVLEPYDSQAYPGSYTLIYHLARPIAYTTVKDLTLHLYTTLNNFSGVTVAVWNHQTNSWTPVPDPQNGENVIAQPMQHVGPGGELRLKIDVAAGGPAQITRADFTLTVQ